mmetsp:Transcript_45288/g.119394  ORF Transcript_45288/g.119394 Transcript_45288/m.119394 type:complete len:666 (+) Transcript_45288:595-2592(+)
MDVLIILLQELLQCQRGQPRQRDPQLVDLVLERHLLERRHTLERHLDLRAIECGLDLLRRLSRGGGRQRHHALDHAPLGGLVDLRLRSPGNSRLEARASCRLLVLVLLLDLLVLLVEGKERHDEVGVETRPGGGGFRLLLLGRGLLLLLRLEHVVGDGHLGDGTAEDKDGEGSDEERHLHHREAVGHHLVVTSPGGLLRRVVEAHASVGEISVCVRDGSQCESDSAPQAGEPHDEHIGGADLRQPHLGAVVGGLRTHAIEHPRANVDVPSPDEARAERDEAKLPDGVVEDGEREDRHPEVDEDVRLGEQRDALVGTRGELDRVVGEIEPRVGGHDHADEEDGDDAGEVVGLGGVVGRPREGERERRLDEEQVVVVAEVQLLEDDRRGDAVDQADDQRTDEDGEEHLDRAHYALKVYLHFRIVEREQRGRQHNGDRVIEDTLAKDHREEIDLHTERLEDSEDGHGVGGRDERAKDERREQRERIADAQLPRVPHDPADNERRTERADERVKHRRTNVVDKCLGVHVEARLEDDGREQIDHEELEVKLLVVDHRCVAHGGGHARRQHPHEHTDARFRQAREVLALQPLPDAEGGRQRQDADDARPFEAHLLYLLLLLQLLLRLRRIIQGTRAPLCAPLCAAPRQQLVELGPGRRRDDGGSSEQRAQH